VSSTTFLYWNFAWKTIVHSISLTFHETEFPQCTDFPNEPDEAFVHPPANETNDADESDDAVDPQPALPTQLRPSQQCTRQEPPIIYDEIVVEKPLPSTLFSCLVPLQTQHPSPSPMQLPVLIANNGGMLYALK
jgi:hypothetical protein